jgi:hypothetical protein
MPSDLCTLALPLLLLAAPAAPRAAATPAASAPAASAPGAAASAVDALGPIVGTWRTTKEATAEAGKTDLTSRCGWSPGRRYVVCDQAGTVAGKPYVASGLYGFGETQRAYVFYALHDGGAPWVGHLIIEGALWTYLDPQPAAPGEKRYKTTNEFTGKDEYQFKIWVSTDGEKWTVIDSGKCVRVK